MMGLHRNRMTLWAGVLAVARVAWVTPLQAAAIDANPSNYEALLRRLKPGDTLNLAVGTYNRLTISGLNGTPEAWITIAGPSRGQPAVIVGDAEHENVEIYHSSYVAIENLRIDSRGIPGAFGVAAHGREANLVHDIRIEGNTFVGQDGSQQTDAISTKTPTWGWIIRYNRILGAGTGIYLGDSDGNQPFVAGLIENNLIRDTIGYNLEIKDQNFLPEIPGMPMGPTTTIIRNNVFIKDDRPSPDGDRPNVLVSSFPATGPGSLNMYEIYGNLFLHNHREALFQASGRVTLHDNLFVDGPPAYPAVVFRKQANPVKIAYVYHNTVYTAERGIYFGSRAMVDDAVMGNLVFASKPISGQIMRQSGNITDVLANAAQYVNAPSFDADSMDFYPKPGKCEGAPADLSLFHTDADYTMDFNGTSKVQAKGAAVFRGAYAATGSNPGARSPAGIKLPPPPSPNAPPVLVWVDPVKAMTGRRAEVTLTGSNFSPGATVTVSGSGVSVGKTTFNGPTQITAVFEVARGAPAGSREVTVSQPSGQSNSSKFQVMRGPAVAPQPVTGRAKPAAR
jgi:hypothetical protein